MKRTCTGYQSESWPEVFYEGFAIKVEFHPIWEKYYSEITLGNDRTFKFWADAEWGDTWQECLIKSMQACQKIIADYGFAPDMFQPEQTWYPVISADCF